MRRRGLTTPNAPPGRIGRITADGAITNYPIPSNSHPVTSQPNTIRPGPDPNAADDCAYQRDTLGDAAFARRYGNFGGCVSQLATTKTLWFTEQNTDRIAQITTDGDIFEFTVPTAKSVPGGLAQGSDSHVWFAELAGNKIGRLDVKRAGKPSAPGQPTSDSS